MLEYFRVRYLAGDYISFDMLTPKEDALLIWSCLTGCFRLQQRIHVTEIESDYSQHEQRIHRCYLITGNAQNRSCVAIKAQMGDPVTMRRRWSMKTKKATFRNPTSKTSPFESPETREKILEAVRMIHSDAEISYNYRRAPVWHSDDLGKIQYYFYYRYKRDHYKMKIRDHIEWPIEALECIASAINGSGELDIFMTRKTEYEVRRIKTPYLITFRREDSSVGEIVAEKDNQEIRNCLFELGFSIQSDVPMYGNLMYNLPIMEKLPQEQIQDRIYQFQRFFQKLSAFLKSPF